MRKKKKKKEKQTRIHYVFDVTKSTVDFTVRKAPIELHAGVGTLEPTNSAQHNYSHF